VIVVDTGCWVDFFNGVDTPQVARLDELLADEVDVAILPIILTEVLQGFRSERDFRLARDLLRALPAISPDPDAHIRAARLHRRLRSEGVTVRGAVDVVIAQACLDADAELLSPDRDFERIAEHSSLRLWRP
jgi:predicted nucleic acid-binding protein